MNTSYTVNLTPPQKQRRLWLKIGGDFDATSAYELIYAIKKLPYDTATLYIYTNGLKAISPFGLDIFHKFMRSLNGQSAKIVSTGNHSSELFPEIPA